MFLVPTNLYLFSYISQYDCDLRELTAAERHNSTASICRNPKGRHSSVPGPQETKFNTISQLEAVTAYKPGTIHWTILIQFRLPFHNKIIHKGTAPQKIYTPNSISPIWQFLVIPAGRVNTTIDHVAQLTKRHGLVNFFSKCCVDDRSR
jgi:hypothetical protein